MPRKKTPQITEAAPVKSYKHQQKRIHIPTQEESIKLSAKQKQPKKKKYAYDPSLNPQLIWAGKQEQGKEFNVATVPIYVQENISPEAIIARLKSGAEDSSQMILFGDTAQEQIHKAIEFYKHEDNWKNRMILGDSLLAMNSLLEKEGMRGKIQTIYIDPPYGIKFGSNWQVSTRKRNVKDTSINDFIRQPEQIKAFRDTWELGIHSYLSYLRDRLIIARELLTESGSCFMQINSENVHLVRNLMDEIFNPENFMNQISFQTKIPLGPKYLANLNDYIIWYAKDKNNIKYRQLYKQRKIEKEFYRLVENNNGEITRFNPQKEGNEIFKKGKPFRILDLVSSGSTRTCIYDFKFEGEKIKRPAKGKSWKTTLEGMNKLMAKNRLVKHGKAFGYKLFFEDYPVKVIDDTWIDTVNSFLERHYVVQTNPLPIQRCILMTTDPGDIVLDPTCGSGTSAFVAEQWGRRWITIDTSRVALALARTRLMSAKYPYYILQDENNLSYGFEYKTVPHITLKSLANDEEPSKEVLYDQPNIVKNVVRVTGPFTVESLAPHRVSDAQEMLSSEKFVETIISNMLKAGVQTGDKASRIKFANLDILPSGPEIQAIGEYQTKSGLKKAAVAIGPEFGSIDDDFIRDASIVAKKFADLLLVAATSFEGSAFSLPSQINGLKIIRVKINPDLSMGDLLKKTGSGNLFLAFGEPEVKIKKKGKEVTIEILGIDIYDPVNSEIRSSGSDNQEQDIAAWFIDTNYNGEAFFVTHAYFLGANKPYEKLKKALKANINEDAWEELYSTTSRPFPKPKTRKIAIKVINHYGDEVMKVIEI